MQKVCGFEHLGDNAWFFFNSLSLFQVGGPSLQQAAVYEEFSRCLPGFLPISAAKVRYIVHTCVDTVTVHVRTCVCVSFRIIIILFHLQQDGMYAGKN